MNLHTEIEVQDELLLVVVHGTLSLDASLRALKQVLDTAGEKQVNRILIDVLDVDGVLTTLERYDLGAQAAAYIQQRQMNPTLAFVGKPPASDGFGVRVAQNRGVITEMFSTRQKALDWLARMAK
jgi:hypothetical protein